MAFSMRIADLGERRADFRREDFRLFEGGEVAALCSTVPVGHLAERALSS